MSNIRFSEPSATFFARNKAASTVPSAYIVLPQTLCWKTNSTSPPGEVSLYAYRAHHSKPYWLCCQDAVGAGKYKQTCTYGMRGRPGVTLEHPSAEFAPWDPAPSVCQPDSSRAVCEANALADSQMTTFPNESMLRGWGARLFQWRAKLGKGAHNSLCCARSIGLIALMRLCNLQGVPSKGAGKVLSQNLHHSLERHYLQSDLGTC